MNKIRVIDLLNKIANGEEVPEKIKFRNDIFRYTGHSYYCDAMYTTFFNIYNFAVLNEKVEIIEEDKKIEPLECYVNAILTGCISKYYEEDFEKSVKHNIDVLGTKINEIIKKINKMENK